MKRTESTDSLFWLLEEPLIYGARLDIPNICGLLNGAFIKSKIVTLGRLINVTGPVLKMWKM